MDRNTPACISPKDRGLAKPSEPGQTPRRGSATTPSLCLSCTRHATTHDLSTITTPRRDGERSSPTERACSSPALTRAGTPHWPRKDRRDNSHLSPVRRHPCATQRRQDNTAKRRQPVRRPTIKIRSDETYVRFHPPRDGIHDDGLDLGGHPSQQGPRPLSSRSWPPTP
jgi:hypothetical protein